jgi:hypothetical protein
VCIQAKITFSFQKSKGENLPIGSIYGEDFYTVEDFTHWMANFQKRKGDTSIKRKGRRGGAPTKLGEGPDGGRNKQEKQHDGVPPVRLQEVRGGKRTKYGIKSASR